MRHIIICNYSILLCACAFLFLTQTAFAGGGEKIHRKKAVFAGGCFWCMEKPFKELNGVVSVTSGYTGGQSENPDYETYAGGGHLEAIEIVYDPKVISYTELLDVFWRQIDPTDPDGQFADRGKAYSTAVFYFDEEQKHLAEMSKNSLDKEGIFNKPVVTPILPAPVFYKAEDYHQEYYRKAPMRYKYYRSGSGRDRFLDAAWGEKRGQRKMPAGELKERLSPLQYHVTQEEGTEAPFDNVYWNNKEEGIYVDVVSGEPLFSSLDKYDSGTGWPSFTKPLVTENIVEKTDKKLFAPRTEVRSRGADSHLGHVFGDGHQPTGLRYCINSAALQFISVKELEEKGYGEFLPMFQKAGVQDMPVK